VAEVEEVGSGGVCGAVEIVVDEVGEQKLDGF
jgi:hypothetical protein